MPQSVVNNQMAFGVQGDAYLDGPVEAAPWTLESAGVPNIIGATAYTVTSEGFAQAGGTGVFAGVLGNSKIQASFGSGSPVAPLNPTMTLPDGTIGTLYLRHTGLIVTLPAAAAIGDKVIYNNATGALSTLPPATAVPGGSTLLSTNAQVVRFTVAAAGLAVIRI